MENPLNLEILKSQLYSCQAAIEAALIYLEQNKPCECKNVDNLSTMGNPKFVCKDCGEEVIDGNIRT